MSSINSDAYLRNNAAGDSLYPRRGTTTTFPVATFVKGWGFQLSIACLRRVASSASPNVVIFSGNKPNIHSRRISVRGNFSLMRTSHCTTRPSLHVSAEPLTRCQAYTKTTGKALSPPLTRVVLLKSFGITSWGIRHEVWMFLLLWK